MTVRDIAGLFRRIQSVQWCAHRKPACLRIAGDLIWIASTGWKILQVVDIVKTGQNIDPQLVGECWIS